MPYTLSISEEAILEHVADDNNIRKSTARVTYLNYLRLGKRPSQDAPAWMWDLWREAQERKQLHQHEEG